MNGGCVLPLGNDQGSILLFGLLSVPLAFLAAYRTRNRAHSIVVGTIVTIGITLVIWMALALLSLVSVGTDGYKVGDWWILIALGLVPAAILGLIEGFVAGLIFRLMPGVALEDDSL